MIDANLRKVYESVLQEDVPDRFAQLLHQLESSEPGRRAPIAEGPEGSDGGAE